MVPAVTPIIVAHGLVSKVLSIQIPRIVPPMVGTNNRHVVSPTVPSIKFSVVDDGADDVSASLDRDFAIFVYQYSVKCRLAQPLNPIYDIVKL